MAATLVFADRGVVTFDESATRAEREDVDTTADMFTTSVRCVRYRFALRARWWL